MQRIIFTYGAISGLIVILSILAGLIISKGDNTAHTSSVWLGYLIMLIALSLIFVGVKRHRDRNLGGVIRFGTALLTGLGIAAVAGVMYVIVWEVYLAMTDYAFINQYTQGIIEAKRAAGVGGAELEQIIANMEAMKQQYANPVFRIAITFSEIFPVGLLIALISAAILRDRRKAA